MNDNSKNGQQCNLNKIVVFYNRHRAPFRRLLWIILGGDICSPLPKSTVMAHPYEITIHSQAIIGDNCIIMNQVTIGAINRGDIDYVPKIGHKVLIGARAKVLGGIVIGDDAKIGANAVVTKSDHAWCNGLRIEPNCTAQVRFV